jgi:hypothetical protein
MASVAASIARIKHDALGALGRGAIEQVCAELGHAWRDRELDPATTVALFVQQVLHGNLPCSRPRQSVHAQRLLPGARPPAARSRPRVADARV